MIFILKAVQGLRMIVGYALALLFTGLGCLTLSLLGFSEEAESLWNHVKEL